MTARFASREWFERSALDVAPEVLGAFVSHTTGDGVVTARITEVEAYRGSIDPGSHAYRGRTTRNASMFRDGGHLYVYRHLGIHHCMNVVCEPSGSASGVLLRAAEIVDGVDLARRRRELRGVARTDRDLAKGPGRLTVALGIDVTHDGTDLIRGCLSIAPATDDVGAIVQGPRVGVSGEGGDGDRYPWRYWIDGDATVSTYRSAR